MPWLFLSLSSELGAWGPAKEAQGGHLGGPDPTPSPSVLGTGLEHRVKKAETIGLSPTQARACSWAALTLNPKDPLAFLSLGHLPLPSLLGSLLPQALLQRGVIFQENQGAPPQGKGKRWVQPEPTTVGLQCWPQRPVSAVLAPDALLW